MSWLLCILLILFLWGLDAVIVDIAGTSIPIEKGIRNIITDDAKSVSYNTVK